MSDEQKPRIWRSGAADAVAEDDLNALLHALHEIVIVTSRTGALLFANRAARELIERGDTFAVAAGQLTGAAGGDPLALARAVERACAEGAGAPQALVIPRAQDTPLVLVVQCLPRSGDALLIARDSHVPVERLVGPLRVLFGLTRTEAEVAVHIAAGRSTEQIAARRCVAPGTIKTQIKSLSAKLGGVRRSQIAAIVKAVPHSVTLERS